MKRLALISFGLVVALASPAVAQRRPKLNFENAVQSIQGSIEPAEARPGQTVTYKVTVRLNPEWYTYPTEQLDGDFKQSRTTLKLPASSDLIFVERLTDPPDFKTKMSSSGSYLYYPGGVTWEVKAVVSPNAAPGEKRVPLKAFTIVVCNEVTENCLAPTTVPVEASFKVTGPKMVVEPKYLAAVNDALGVGIAVQPAKQTPKDNLPAEEPKVVSHRLRTNRDYAADMKAVQDQLPPPESKNTGFWKFLATAAAFGFLTLLTPCVFPMVPITVSIFLKQSQKQGTNVLALALVYAVTIVVLLSVAALTVLAFFSELAVDPITNVLLGALFVILAFSLFGLFEITLPSSLSTALDNRAGRGGYLGTVFMAASFTVVSFTCVAPFLGGFSGMATSGNFSRLELAAGALTFATAFASPFFLLALFPSLIKKLPKSGDWMNMVKVTMGFLELAAALKFFRTAELRWLTPPEYFTYDLVLSLWVSILVAMALYLFGVFRTKHDHETHDHVGPWRIMFALTALGLAVYLLPALFSSGPRERNRPAGTVYAWVDAFLLPEPSAAEMAGGDLAWSGDLRRALDDARAKGGRVFIDFTGVTCSNCRLNEREVFVKPAIKDLFKQYSLVQIYTDTVPEYFYESAPGIDRQTADAKMINKAFQKNAFGEEQLPLYVILKPEQNGMTTVVGVYDEGKINDEPKFIEFLKNGLK